MSRPPDIQATDALLVDYVLGELAPEEARTLEQRLAAEPGLAEEVARLRATLDLVPHATVTAPPPHLRATVLQAARRATKLRAARPRMRPAWSTLAAAAAAVVAIALGIDGYRLRQELRLQQNVTAILQEPNIVQSFAMAGMGPASGAIGTVKLDLDARKGAVALERLPDLPNEQVYRLWARLVNDETVPCGEFGVSAAGTALAQFAVPVDAYTAPIAKLFLTVERRDAPLHPSGPTLMESV